MSELQEIEKILKEASSVGLRSKTIEAAYNILNRNRDIDRVSAYQLAFNTLLSTTEDVDDRDINDTPVYVDNEDDDLDYSEQEEERLDFFKDIDDVVFDNEDLDD